MQSKPEGLFLSLLVMNLYYVLFPPDCSLLISDVLGTVMMGFIVPILSTADQNAFAVQVQKILEDT